MRSFVVPLFCAVSLQACAGEMPMPSHAPVVSEALRVETPGQRVLVHFSATNTGDAAVYLPAAVASAQTLTRREFDVLADGKPVPYAGRMVKRGPLTADDYVKLAPHATLANTIDITDAYAWPAGSHAYTVSYDGSYLTDLAHLDAPTAVTVERAAFLK
jgi:hypothetical protein